MIRKEILENQALKAHALFWDDPHRDLTRSNGTYYNLEKGVEVLENGDVRFAYLAPDAKRVQVAGTGGSFPDTPIDLVKGEDGWWSVTVPGLESAFHFCNFYVDGSRALNPYMPYGYGFGRVMNFFELPDKYSDFYLFHDDIPHGSVRMNYFYSETVGDWRTCWVYTPPGYLENKEKRYPVFYLQHGGGEAETGWLWQGKIHYIMDNLIAQGICRKAIVVMNNGYAFVRSAIENPNMGSIGEVIVHDCVPFIDKKYRTIPDRKMRAMAGLSMGGFQTQEVVFRHPDVFANLAMLSGTLLKKYEGDDYTAIFEDPQVFKNDFGVFFLSMGSEEKSLIENNLSLAEELRAKGVDVKTFITPGYHEWEVWRYSIREFLKFAFQA